MDLKPKNSLNIFWYWHVSNNGRVLALADLSDWFFNKLQFFCFTVCKLPMIINFASNRVSLFLIYLLHFPTSQNVNGQIFPLRCVYTK